MVTNYESREKLCPSRLLCIVCITCSADFGIHRSSTVFLLLRGRQAWKTREKYEVDRSVYAAIKRLLPISFSFPHIFAR